MAKRPKRPPRRRPPMSAATFIQRSRAESSEQKAIWHNVTGAGRRHVRREFFDLNGADQQVLRDALETAVASRVREAQR